MMTGWNPQGIADFLGMGSPREINVQPAPVASVPMAGPAPGVDVSMGVAPAFAGGQPGGLMDGLTPALTQMSPLLMAMGQNMLAPPNQRDPRAVQIGMAQMGQNAEKAQRKARLAAMQEQIMGLEGVPPAIRNAAAMSGEKGPEIIARYLSAQAGRTQINNNVSTGDAVDTRPIVDKPPKGFQRVWDAQTGKWRDEPIEGSDVERERVQEEAAEAGREASRARYGGIVLDDVGRAIDLVQNQTTFDPVTGLFGAVASMFPGTSRADFEGLASGIEANIAFDRLQEMRNNSPTGGAVGQLSDDERRAMAATLGSIAASQSKEQLVNNLQRLERLFLNTVHGDGKWAKDEGKVYLLTPDGWVQM